MAQQDDLNVAAFTPVTDRNYPPYISINKREGAVHITVRGNPSDDGKCGPQANIVLSHREFGDLFQSVMDAYRTGKINSNEGDEGPN